MMRAVLQTYDPQEYWTARPAMTVQRPHANQEIALLKAIEHIDPMSILEVGVGLGRVGKLLCERWPGAKYTGIDLSPGRLAEARKNLPEYAELVHDDLLDWDPDAEKYDLVIAVEVLMHVRPQDAAEAVARLFRWSSGYVCTVDWTQAVNKPIASHNFIHDYGTLSLPAVARTGLQSIHLAEV